MFKRIALMTTAGVLTASTAFAATDATATTDLNLRAAPGPQAEIVGVIPGDGAVTVQQCITESQWCKVSFEGQEGWAYSAYLTAPLEGQPVVVYDNRDALAIEQVEIDGTKEEGALIGGTLAGSLIAATVGGPVGAVAAATVAGAAAGAASQPGDEVVTYVRDNPTDPVYLDGEVVVGAAVPELTDLSEIPGTDYRYVYVNGVPAVVEPEGRTIVSVVR